MRTAPVCVITQRILAISYRRFGIACRSHPQGSRAWPLEMGPTDCPETSLIIYYYQLFNSPEEHSSQLLRGGCLKSRICNLLFTNYPAIGHSRSAGWLTKWLTDRLTYLLTEWLIDWLTDLLTEWLIDWLSDWQADLFIDWLTDSTGQCPWEAATLWLVKQFSAWFITVLTTASFCFCRKPNQSCPRYPILLPTIHFNVILPSATWNPLPPPRMKNAPPVSSFLVWYPNNIVWAEHNMKLLIT